MKLEFSRQCFEKAQISSFIEIRPVEAELFHAGGRTDMTMLIITFRNFANASKYVSTPRSEFSITPIPGRCSTQTRTAHPEPVKYNAHKAIRQHLALNCVQLRLWVRS
jgi:hypothetical protein